MTDSWILYPDREAWLRDRQVWLGASDIPVLLGFGYGSSTPLRLWLERTGRSEPEPASARLEIGTALEPIVGKLATEAVQAELGTDWRVYFPPGSCGRPGGHRLKAAFVDGLAVTLDASCSDRKFTARQAAGQDAPPPGSIPLELKTVSGRAASLWDDKTPPPYPTVQAGVQALTMEAPFSLVFALTGLDEGRRLYTLPAPPPSFQELVKSAVEAFWKAVADDEPPPAVASDTETLAKWFGKPKTGSVIELEPAWDAELDRMAELSEEAKRIESEAEAIKNRLKLALGETEAGVLVGTQRAVRWSLVEGMRKPTEAVPYSYRRFAVGRVRQEELERIQKGGGE